MKVILLVKGCLGGGMKIHCNERGYKRTLERTAREIQKNFVMGE